MSDTQTPLLVLGTRTLAEEVVDLASEVPGLAVAGFVENLDRERCASELNGLPVHWVDDVGRLAGTHVAVCALATTKRRRFVEQVERLGLRFATLVHPLARVSATSTVGEGSIVSVGAVVASHTKLGRHVLVNRGALIGHHTEIGDFVSIQPGANVAGACRIGSGSYIGMGAIVVDHVTIGEGVVVGAGSVVARDVPPNVQVVGVPARVVKEGVDGL